MEDGASEDVVPESEKGPTIDMIVAMVRKGRKRRDFQEFLGVLNQSVTNLITLTEENFVGFKILIMNEQPLMNPKLKSYIVKYVSRTPKNFYRSQNITKYLISTFPGNNERCRVFREWSFELFSVRPTRN